MLSTRDYASHDAVGLADLVRRREVAPLEILEAALRLADERNPRLNAIIHRMDDEARRAIAAGLPDGPLRGVPFLLKDLGVAMKGQPMTNGSRLFADYVPAFDAELTRRYRAAGLVIFGKTNTPEMGMCCNTEPLLHGPTRNPWDLSRSPGGSSGGASAAVAAGIVPAAHGSDSAGSVRIPASDCGLFGLMATRGRIGMGPSGDPLGVGRPHVLTRTVRDSAALLDGSAGAFPGEPFRPAPPARPYLEEVGAPPGRLRIGYAPKSPSGERVDPECVAAAEDAAKLCAELGHAVEEIAPPVPIEPILAAGPLVCFLRSRLEARAKERGRPISEGDLERTLRAIYDYAGGVTGEQYFRALQAVHDCAYRLGAFFRDYDILLSPVLANPPVPLGTFDMNRMSFDEYMTDLYVKHMPFTRQFNFSGGPAMSVPLHLAKGGLPVGVQFGADAGREDVLFRLAAQLESARPWRHPHAI
jgi:Asp-tRNA(Asn)/Glu-tRNA(Gln) amidotransferase A subunit family amidase